MHAINGDTNMTALQAYTVKLYDELEKESGQVCGSRQMASDCRSCVRTSLEREGDKTASYKPRYPASSTNLPNPMQPVSPPP